MLSAGSQDASFNLGAGWGGEGAISAGEVFGLVLRHLFGGGVLSSKLE